MRTIALRSLGLLLAFALLALLWASSSGPRECARAALASDEAAVATCAHAARWLFATTLGLLGLAAVVVNVLDQWRFGRHREPPQPDVLATLATCAALLAIAALLPARFAALALVTPLAAATSNALQLVAVLAAAVAAVLAVVAGIAIWLGRPPSQARSGEPPQRA